jgi:hypothetical protein
LGSAFALGLIALLTRASWPVRIGLIMVALFAAAGYLVIRARRSDAEPVPESQEDSAVSPASAVSPDPAAATPDPAAATPDAAAATPDPAAATPDPAAAQAQPAPNDPKDTQP